MRSTTIVAVAIVAVLVVASGADALARKRSASGVLSQANCDCSWANQYTCGTNDGSVCFQQCCLQGAQCTAIKGKCGTTGSCKGPNSIVKGKCPGKGDNVCCVPPSSSTPTPTPVTPTPTPNPPSTGGVDASLTSNGITTRYWDCCKPSCAWRNNVPSGKTPVRTCDKNGVTKVNADTNNVCAGGGIGGAAYTCNDQQPFVRSGVAYGFVATQVGQCCDCFELQFKSTNKKMVVQRTNTGGDLSSNQFDIQMPGGGVGIYNGCYANAQNGPAQWGTSSAGAWGQTYGGVSSRAACGGLPAALQAGCQFRFDWVGDNPQVRFKKVACPAALTDVSGCK